MAHIKPPSEKFKGDIYPEDRRRMMGAMKKMEELHKTDKVIKEVMNSDPSMSELFWKKFGYSTRKEDIIKAEAQRQFDREHKRQ